MFYHSLIVSVLSACLIWHLPAGAVIYRLNCRLARMVNDASVVTLVMYVWLSTLNLEEMTMTQVANSMGGKTEAVFCLYCRSSTETYTSFETNHFFCILHLLINQHHHVVSVEWELLLGGPVLVTCWGFSMLHKPTPFCELESISLCLSLWLTIKQSVEKQAQRWAWGGSNCARDGIERNRQKTFMEGDRWETEFWERSTYHNRTDILTYILSHSIRHFLMQIKVYLLHPAATKHRQLVGIGDFILFHEGCSSTEWFLENWNCT